MGKKIDKSPQVEREVLDLVKAEQELMLRREAKLAKWFADTELSGKDPDTYYFSNYMTYLL